MHIPIMMTLMSSPFLDLACLLMSLTSSQREGRNKRREMGGHVKRELEKRDGANSKSPHIEVVVIARLACHTSGWCHTTIKFRMSKVNFESIET